MSNRVIINSEIDADLASNSLTDFEVFLSKPIQVEHGEMLRLGLKRVIIPTTIYTFHTEENTVYYIIDNTLHQIQLNTERVFLDGEELEAHLNTLLEQNGHSNLNFSFSQSSNKLTFTNNSNNEVRLLSDNLFETEYNGTTLFNNAIARLGFYSDLRDFPLQNGEGLEADGVIRLMPTKVLHITSDLIGDRDITTSPNPNYSFSVLNSVMNNVSYGGLLTKSYAKEDMLYFDITSTITRIDIQIRDDKYRIINNHGAGCYLEFEYEYV